MTDTHSIRLTLPLKLARAITIHKAQGLTLASVVIEIGKKKSSSGLSFVACFHVWTIDNLLLHPVFSFQHLANLSKSVGYRRGASKMTGCLQTMAHPLLCQWMSLSLLLCQWVTILSLCLLLRQWMTILSLSPPPPIDDNHVNPFPPLPMDDYCVTPSPLPMNDYRVTPSLPPMDDYPVTPSPPPSMDDYPATPSTLPIDGYSVTWSPPPPMDD